MAPDTPPDGGDSTPVGVPLQMQCPVCKAYFAIPPIMRPSERHTALIRKPGVTAPFPVVTPAKEAETVKIQNPDRHPGDGGRLRG